MTFRLRKTLLFLGLAAAGLASCGQPTGPVTLDWHVNAIEARQLANQLHHPLLYAFMGSDWSQPCQDLQKEVLETQAFKDFADANLVLVMVDFPRASPLQGSLAAQNEQIAKGGQVDRFPTLLLVDPNNNFVCGHVTDFTGNADLLVTQLQSTWDRYQTALANAAQAAPASPPSGAPTLSQPASMRSSSLPALPSSPGSLPSPEELFRRQPQAPPSP